MAWCPKCGAQYREGFSRCSECGVELTTEPPPDAGVGPEWVTVATFAADEEARLAVGFLAGRGVRAEILDQQMHIEPYGMAILDEIRLMVPPGDEQKARALLAEAQVGGASLPDDDAGSDPGGAEDDEA